MKKIYLFSEISETEKHIDKKAYEILKDSQNKTTVGVYDFNIIPFNSPAFYSESPPPKIYIYLDRENIFFFCETKDACKKISKIFEDAAGREKIENERLLYLFIIKELKKDADILNSYEMLIAQTEEAVSEPSEEDKKLLNRISKYRRDIMGLKRYYKRFVLLLDDLTANGNGLLSENGVKSIKIAGERAQKLLEDMGDLRDHISQVLEIYRSQLDYKQNSLMKVFTVVTAVFMPLTLLAGWYGMNFNMPEFRSPYGYPAVAAAAVVIAVVMLIIFKKKKWL